MVNKKVLAKMLVTKTPAKERVSFPEFGQVITGGAVLFRRAIVL